MTHRETVPNSARRYWRSSCSLSITNNVVGEPRLNGQFARRYPLARFGSLGSTEQETAGNFYVSFLKPSGALGLYYPDWVAVQGTEQGEVNWIIETKGRVWDGTENKDAAIRYWCEQVSRQTGASWRFIRVNQTDFGGGQFQSFAELLETLDDVAPAAP